MLYRATSAALRLRRRADATLDDTLLLLPFAAAAAYAIAAIAFHRCCFRCQRCYGHVSRHLRDFAMALLLVTLTMPTMPLWSERVTRRCWRSARACHARGYAVFAVAPLICCCLCCCYAVTPAICYACLPPVSIYAYASCRYFRAAADISRCFWH